MHLKFFFYNIVDYKHFKLSNTFGKVELKCLQTFLNRKFRSMIKQLILILFIILYVITKSTAQNYIKIDSLRKAILTNISDKKKAFIFSEIAEEYYHNAPDSALKYCNIGMKYGIKNNDISDMAYFHNFLGVLYKNTAQYDSSEYHFNESIKLNKKDDFEKGVAAGLNNLGQTLVLKGDYDKALNSYFSSLEIFEKFKDTLNIGELHSNIGGLLVKINEFQAAGVQFNLSRKFYKMAGAKLQEAWILYDTGNLKMKIGNPDSALILFKESAKIWSKFNRTKDYNNCMLRIGEILMVQNKYSAAEIIFNQSYEKFNSINYLKGSVESLMFLGRAQFLQKKYQPAIENLYQALHSAQILKLNRLEMDINYYLYICYKELKKFDKALEFQEKYQILKDTIFSKERNNLIAEYQTKLNLKNKEAIIKELEDSTLNQILFTENIAKQNKLKQRSIYFLISGISITIILIILLFQRNKANINLNKKLNISLKEREILIREVHHRVKNNLQIISSLLNLQHEKTDEVSAKEILKVSQSRIEAMSMIHENLYKSEKLSEIDFRDYIQNLCNYIETSFNLKGKGITLQVDVESVQIGIDQLVPCGLIINELLTNSIKHAFSNQLNKLINVNCFTKNQLLCIKISDNGSGLPKGFDIKQSKSLGIRLASGLALQLKSKLYIESEKGTQAYFEFYPLKNDIPNS